MLVWFYVFHGCTRTCVCGCDCDVVCVGHDLNWYTGWNASFKLTLFGCLISICCVDFASLDVVCDELNECVWNVCL